jgi:putative FmdB family regulatory protein
VAIAGIPGLAKWQDAAMPVYEYACTACGERTEARQGFDDPPLEVCPNCGGKLRKLYSPVGIVFKGSGFYSTDQKSKKSAKEPSKETTKEPASTSSGGGDKAAEKAPGTPGASPKAGDKTSTS